MLERLSWKRLVLELILCCIPAFILSIFLGHLPWFFAGISHRIAYLAFLELTTPLLVALGRQKYDATTRARELGAIAVWHPSDAITQ